MAQHPQHQNPRWLQQVLASPRLVLSGFLLVFLGCLAVAFGLEIDQGLEFFLIENDPDRIRNQEIKVDFSNDELIFLALDLKHSLNRDDLLYIADLSAEIEGIAGVEDVLSLTTVEDIRADGDLLDTSPLFGPTAFENDGSLESRIERLRDHPIFEGNLISRDLDAVAIVIQPQLEDGKASGSINQGIIHALEERIPHLAYDAYLGGYPAAEVDSTRIATSDLIVLTGVAFTLILLLAFILLRHWLALVMIVVLASFSQLVAIATLVLLDAPFTSVTATLPTILLATTSAYAIYAFSLLKQRSAVSESPGIDLASELSRPCVVSAVSTAAGFLALLTTPILAIQHLGIGLAAGILACLTGALLLLPALIELLPNHLPPIARAVSESDELSVTGYARGVQMAQHPWRVFLVAFLILILSIIGITRLQIESNPITYWKKDSFHRVSDDFLQQEFDGALFVNLILTTEEPEGALRPEVLEFARRLITLSKESGVVTDSLSVLDYLELLDDALNTGSAADDLPEVDGSGAEIASTMEVQNAEAEQGARRYFSSEGLASQYMLLYENSGNPEDFEDFIDFDRSALNIFLKVNSRSSTAILALRQRLLDAADETAFARPNDTTVEVLGTWLLFPKAMDGISRYMVKGLLAAVAAILVLMVLTLRSIKLGLVSMLPNIFPIVVCLGVMGWLEIPLSFVTSITGCLALGLAVDDTAHILGHLDPRGGRDNLIRSYNRVGRALLITTLCVGGGFLALTFSQFLPIAHMGFAAAITLAVALMSDLWFLPSILLVAERLLPGTPS